MGYVTIVDPEHAMFEADTVHCAHCNRAWFIKATDRAKADLGHHCLNCDAPVCSRKECEVCVPFLKKLEEYEARARFWRTV